MLGVSWPKHLSTTSIWKVWRLYLQLDLLHKKFDSEEQATKFLTRTIFIEFNKRLRKSCISSVLAACIVSAGERQVLLKIEWHRVFQIHQIKQANNERTFFFDTHVGNVILERWRIQSSKVGIACFGIFNPIILPNHTQSVHGHRSRQCSTLSSKSSHSEKIGDFSSFICTSWNKLE